VVVDRTGRPIPRWLAVSRERAPELKEIGELGSQDRLDSLQRVDDIRESEQARSARSRARDDRQLLAVAGIAAGIFLLVVLALSLASLL
jgi:ferric-dicitrate binding protein FerR (iron transport regulator)